VGDTKDVSFGSYHLIYVGSDGKRTERDVDILRFNFTEKKEAFYAYCHWRQDFREFLLRGIQELYSDGQLIPNPQEYLRQLYQKSGKAIDYKALEKPLSLIKAVWWFAGADGLCGRKELNVVAKCARDFISDFDEKFGRSYINQLKVSSEDMMSVVKIAAEWSEEYKEAYFAATKKLIEIKINHYAETLNNYFLFVAKDDQKKGQNN